MLRLVSRHRRNPLIRVTLFAIALAVLSATAPQILVHDHEAALAEHGHSHASAGAEHVAGPVPGDAGSAPPHDGAQRAPHDPASADPAPLDPPTTDEDAGALHVHDATGVATVFTVSS